MRAINRRDVILGMVASATALAYPGLAQAAAADTGTLRAIADRKGLSFGSAIDPELLNRPEYVKLILDQCNTIVPRNTLKWNATEQSPGRFKYDVADKVVAFAQQNNLAVRGTTLIWYRSPTWVQHLDNPKDVTTAMTRHITTLMGRYAGKIASWDVVNEPFEYDSSDLRKSVFFKQLGEEHIDLAFHTARAADPKAQLVLNETHLSEAGDVYDAKRKAVMALIDRLLARKVPIDAIGIQGHIRPGLDKIDGKGFGGFCSDLKSRGLGVLLTELDASCRFIKRVPGFKQSDYGKPFSDQISIAEATGKLTSVIVWGLSPFGLKPNEPGSNAECRYRINLFDNELQPLPSFDAVRAAMQGDAA
ncbi:MAG TPA: endo-1,4-beta-xylanase [Arsenicitalea sp.]|nr:endo-1,4-beta-xylanase [Arsenicitalea sp.]